MKIAESGRAGLERSAIIMIRATAILRFAGIAVTFALLGGAAGCEAVGALAYKASGQSDVPAVYVPIKKPTLILVVKSDNPGEDSLESDRIGQLISAKLREHGVVPLVDPSPISEVRSSDPSRYRKLTPVQAARLVKAQQVLHVDIAQITVEDALATEMARGRMDVHVRVIDAGSGETLWPQDTTQGFPMSVDDPYARSGSHQTAIVLRDKMCQDIADKIARLFYKYPSDSIDGAEAPADDLGR